MPPRCYLAGPLGFTEGGRRYYDEVYVPAVRSVVDPVDPWALTTPQELSHARAGGPVVERELALTIGRRNAEAIRSSQLLAAYLEGQELDAGTAAEVGYATALGLRCFGLRSDLRRSGESGVVVNLQVETFILDSGGAILATLAELVEALGDAADALGT